MALDQTFETGGLYAVRAAVAAYASELGAAALQVENLVMIASELATNAIAYGGGGGRLRVWREGALLRCEISDHGPGLESPEQAGEEKPPASAVGGRGLWIARRLSDALDITNGPGAGATITATIDLNRPPREP
jgi:anti-sigma regulatory factor (Ser/Thr protein kinase)